MSRPRISRMIHAVDPYEGFDYQAYPSDVQGWGSDHEIFAHAIVTYRPKTIVEVGTWKGRSAIVMANLLKPLEIEAEIVCVDTFLGSTEHWISEDYYPHLRHRHGYPTLYYQFLANVCHAGFQNTITPFPISSEHAARYFIKKQIQADLIYLDAGHSYEEVLRELHAYWELLNPGGALMGDDFVATWPGVIRAVTEFASIIKVPGQHYKGKFIFTKPT